MKIKKNITLEQLSHYGWTFEEITDQYGDPIYMDDIMFTYKIGHSRRGQFYYYLIMKDRTIKVYASDPDGSGTWIDLDEVIIKMYNDGIIEM